MPYGDLIADGQRPTLGIKFAGMRDMQHGIVLHAGARTDANAVHIATDDGAGPNRAVLAQVHIANHHRSRVDVDGFIQLGLMTGEWTHAICHSKAPFKLIARPHHNKIDEAKPKTEPEKIMSPSANNPLLEAHRLPPFDKIHVEHMVEAVRSITEENLQALDTQLANLSACDWPNLVEPIEARDDRLNQAWSPISHLNGVANDEALREAYQQCIAILTPYNTQIGQNKALFDAYVRLRESEGFVQLNQAQKQTIDNAIRDFKLAGVNLEADKKARFAQIQETLSKLTNQFSNNVLDATQGWFKHITDEAQLAGLPQSALGAAAQAAKEKELPGWVFTLDGPVYLTVMTQADNAELRREMYTAYMTRASAEGPRAKQWDNSEIIEQIMGLRQELAQLLGFDNYAERSIAPKMAESTQQVLDFFNDLAAQVKPAAEAELEELGQWTQQQYGVAELQVWDVPYYSEKLKEAKYEISQERLRPYFALPKVLDGLFDVAQKLFNIHIQAEPSPPLWHPDARLFSISRDGEVIAQFFLDPFARAGKRGGAWMAECRVRRQTGDGTQKPVAYLVCNFNAPVAEQPSLLTHNEVTTLFHEFGHGLHHMLTQVDVASVSGINGVAWDAVELPSQFMENWCWQPEVLKGLSAHVESGESLPDAMIEKMLAAKNFQSAMMTLRQIEFALFDFRLHMEYGKPGFAGVQALLNEVRAQVAVLIPPSFNRFQNGFTHIFAGGYAAGYYSYKWAEVLSADAFAAFEEEGIFNPQVGQRFLTNILERGGSQDAMSLFKAFRGREPSTDALLRHSGIRRAS